WTFLNYPWFTKDDYLKENFNRLLKEVTELTEVGLKRLEGMSGKIIANDISERAILSATENINKARLGRVIHLGREDALKVSAPAGKVLYLCNPPYGERLEHGEEEKLRGLYKGLGDHWKHNFR